MRLLTTSAPVFFIREASSPTPISSGILTVRGGLLGDLQLEPAHLLLLLLAALVAEVAAPAVVAAALNLLLAALHLVGPLRRQVLQVLVVPGQVDVARFPGVHQLLLRDPGGGAVGGLLGLLSLLGAAFSRGASPLFRGHRSGPGGPPPGWISPHPASAGPASAAVPVLGAVVLTPSPPWGRWRNGLQVRDLVVLGQVFKDDGQFLVVQHLHVVFGVVAYVVRIWVMSLVCFPKSLATSCTRYFSKLK